MVVMLTLLRIQNLALVHHAEIEFGEGLIAVTGESGAGKSTLLDALSLLSGQPRPRVRPSPGEKSGLVEGVFQPTARNRAQVEELFEELGIPVDDEIVLTRRLEANGRSRCFLQGQMVQRPVLAQVSALFIEQCGQSQAHGLRTSTAQLDALDHFADLESCKTKYQAAYRSFRQLSREYQDLQHQEMERERQRDFLEFQLAELAECDLARHVQARAELEECQDAAGLEELCQEIQNELARNGQGMIARLSWLAKKAQVIGSDESDSLSSSLLESMDGLEQLERLSENVAASVEGRSREAEVLEREVATVQRLADKHRVPVEELADKERALRNELAELKSHQDRMKTLSEQVAQAERAAHELAESLHDRRVAAAARLDRAVEKELGTLGLQEARFKTKLWRSELGPHGISHLEVGFSANRGSPLAPLARVASGGELSRILLCLRLAAHSRASLLTFDEIDSGAGGVTAEQIGEALARVARGCQVLCVTHWPQVAGLARYHLLVEKTATNERTQSQVSPLADSERVEELARMLGGTADTAVSHAQRLLKQPRSKKARRQRAA